MHRLCLTSVKMDINILPNEYIALFAALFGALLLSKVVASGIYKFAEQIHAAASHVFARYLTTSIEIHVSYGPTESSWIETFIEHKCGRNLNHFRITKNNKISDGLTGLLKKNKEVGELEDEVISCAKKLEPLATNWTVTFW